MADLVDLGLYTQVTSLGTSPTTYPWAGGSDYTFPKPVRFMRATGAGVIQYVDANGDTVLAAFAAGETRALAAQAIVDAGTTATGVEGMP